MPTKKPFRQVLAERRHYEKNSGERLTDIGGNTHRPMNTPELVKHLVATQLSQIGVEAGFETFEEADDLEDEDPEPPWVSQFEIHEMEPDHLEPFQSPPEGERHDIEDDARDETSQEGDGADPELSSLSDNDN